MSRDKDEILAMAREAGGVQLFTPRELGAFHKKAPDIHISMMPEALERFAALCRAPLVAEVERLTKEAEINAHNAKWIFKSHNQACDERDDWKARALKAEQVGEQEIAGYFVPEGWDALGRVTDWAQVVKNQGTPLYAPPPQPAAQEPTSAVPANAKPEKAKPYAWRNPMNGVVISNDKKERLLCVGAGYPNFSEPLYAAGQKFIKENCNG